MIKPLAATVAVLLCLPAAARSAESYPGQSQMVKLGLSIGKRLGTTELGTIVIAPACNQDLQPTRLGQLLEWDFVLALKRARREKVVQLSNYKAISRQQRLEETALVDPDRMSQLARMLPAKVLIILVVEPLPGLLRVRAVASEMQTAAILAGDSIDLYPSDALISRLSAEERRALRYRVVSQERKVVSKIRYELLGCRRKTNTVTCSMDLTSLRGDQRVRLSTTTLAIDSRGKPYEAKRFHTGKQRGWRLLMKDIPSHVHFEFANVSGEVKFFKTLELKGKELGARFTGVPIIG